MLGLTLNKIVRTEWPWATLPIVLMPLINWGLPAEVLTTQVVLDQKVHGHTTRALQEGIEPTEGDLGLLPGHGFSLSKIESIRTVY